jgi:integrase
MWLTLCRPSEVMGAAWEEFDLEAAVWGIPPSG